MRRLSSLVDYRILIIDGGAFTGNSRYYDMVRLDDDSHRPPRAAAANLFMAAMALSFSTRPLHLPSTGWTVVHILRTADRSGVAKMAGIEVPLHVAQKSLPRGTGHFHVVDSPLLVDSSSVVTTS